MPPTNSTINVNRRRAGPELIRALFRAYKLLKACRCREVLKPTQSSEPEPESQCVICQSSASECSYDRSGSDTRLISLPCGCQAVFHEECLVRQWFTNSETQRMHCPACRCTEGIDNFQVQEDILPGPEVQNQEAGLGNIIMIGRDRLLGLGSRLRVTEGRFESDGSDQRNSSPSMDDGLESESGREQRN